MKSSTWKIACALSCALSLWGCNLTRGDDVDETPTPPPVAPAPAPTPQEPAAPEANEVIRYSNMESADQGTLSVRNAIRARKAADFISDIIDTLPVGAEVDRVARYGGFTLVSWTSDAGPRQGWIDAAQATRTLAVVPTTTATVTVVPTVAVKPATPTRPTPTFLPIAPKTGSTAATTKTPVLKPKTSSTTKTPPRLGK